MCLDECNRWPVNSGQTLGNLQDGRAERPIGLVLPLALS